VPANAEIFFRQLMSITAFEVFEIGDIVNALLALEPTSPINDNYNTLGFESVYYINNMGTLFLMFLIYPIMMLVEYLLGLVAEKCDSVKKVHLAVKYSVYWNSLIRLVFESYSMIAICCLIHFEYISFSNVG